MDTLQQAAIYWIHLPQHVDFTTQGYIGVSKNYSKRLTDHLGQLLSEEHKNSHLTHAFNKYGWDNLIKEVILFGEESYCYQIEGEIRSTKNIGWHIAIGGRRGPGWPKGRKKDPETVKKGLDTRKNTYAKKLYQRSIIIAKEKEEKRKLKEDKKNAQLQLSLQQKEEKRKLKEDKKNAQLQLSLQQKEEKRKLKEDLRSQGRQLCPNCNNSPVAVNYIRSGVRHYRNSCPGCIRKGKKLKPEPAAWQKSGYKKTERCEKCNFKFALPSQSVVFHVDGNLKNNNWLNLKTVCLNCQQEVYKSRLPWRPATIVPDF